jgi:hypothetical protein
MKNAENILPEGMVEWLGDIDQQNHKQVNG